MLLIPLSHGVGLFFLLAGGILISIVIPIVVLSVLWVYLHVTDWSTETDSTSVGRAASKKVWGRLGTGSPIAFLVAGMFLVVFTAVRSIEMVVDTTPPDPVGFAFGTAGFAVAFIGLFGLYPTLADRTPWLARASVAFALVPGLGWFGLTMWNTGVGGGFVHPGDTNLLIGGLYILTAVMTVPVYVLFGIASLRADAHLRIVSYLLLAVPILFLAGVIGSHLIFGSGEALAHLIIGGLLLARGGPTNNTGVPPDSTA